VGLTELLKLIETPECCLSDLMWLGCILGVSLCEGPNEPVAVLLRPIKGLPHDREFAIS